MTRMLALVGEAYGGAGGIAQYNRDLFAALVGDGRCQIDILPRHGGGHPAPPPAGMRQDKPASARLAYSLRAMTAGRRVRPDIVFCGHLFMAPLAGLIARQTGAKLLIQLHGIEAWDKPNAAVQRAVARADLVACVSRDTRARFLAWADLAPERCVVVSNTVSAEYSPADRTVARAKWNLGSQTVLLSVSRLDAREQYKGQDRVIAALPGLIAQGRDVLYMIAGDGDDRPRLETLARTAGVADYVRFLGSVPHDDMPDLYRACDLFVLPSTGEGFGIVFLEAMACGAPALGLAAGGAVDALADGELGVAVEPDAFPDALAAAIARKPLPRPALAKAVQARFGAEAFAQRATLLMDRLAA